MELKDITNFISRYKYLNRFLFIYILLGALSLIRYCLTPTASNRATTKDILRHEWLAHGPTLSVRLNSPIKTMGVSTVSLPTDNYQPASNDYEKVHLRSSSPTKKHDRSVSPTNSLVELELHTSSFFDTAKLRNNHNNNNHGSSVAKDQQRRNRASAIPESTRYYQSNNTKPTPSSTSTSSPYRRPLSLSLDDNHSKSPTDYHFASTSEKPSQVTAAVTPAQPPLTSSSQAYPRQSRRTVSPSTTTTTTTLSKHINNDRLNSPQATQRYSVVRSPETTKRQTSPVTPSRYLVSYDFDTTLRDLKRKPIYKYTPPAAPISTTDLNAVPSIANSTTSAAPSVFTTSARFAPPPIRRRSPYKDSDPTNSNTSSINPSRLGHNSTTNSISNLDDSITNASSSTNPNHRRSLLTSLESPPPSTTIHNSRKSRLLDDNNNFISLKVHE
ncbi:unnamed protein product [Adineta ricciae]|uniref:Uncharacterized protein n=1 Tax=Adineta ricciae TaxID=249248 RepID=A0A813RFU3_ADIRI|nr:unnamed protein product [Adineta ricciae]